MRTYRIAVVGGDGIGPEVIGCALDVLAEACRAVSGFELDFVEAPAGAGTYLDRGEALPEATLAACRAADAILLGACGLPGVRYPDGTEIIPQVTLRIVLDLYAGIAPHAGSTASRAPWRAIRRSTSSWSARAPRGSSPRSAGGSCSATSSPPIPR